MLTGTRLVLVLALVTITAACGDGFDAPRATSDATSAASPASAIAIASSAGAPEATATAVLVPEATMADASPAQAVAPTADGALTQASSQQLAGAAEPAHAAPRAGVAGSPIFTRTVGKTTIRFWSILEARTGRDRFEYHFHVTVKNGGSGLLRGAVLVTSNSAASRVAVSCVPFGTTPPGITRDADAPFVIAQARATPFDPSRLAFSIDTTPDPSLCRDPGRVTLRRLNRSEYDNTVRDLLGTTKRPALDFPADDFGYGFDTIGDVLAISPLLFEKAEAAARSLVEDALRIDPPSPQIAALRALCTPAVDGATPCLRKRLTEFLRRAWRRPPTETEIETLVALAGSATLGGADFEASLGAAMTAAMTSPHFLFHVERDPQPRSAEIHALSDHELATRLSYFLWSSMPDVRLDDLADTGKLDMPVYLVGQVRRMVRDPKARGFVESFAGQWLATRALDDVTPDSAAFPGWDDALKEAMREETHLVFQEFLQTQTDFLGFFDAKFTYLNDRLAQHYGLPAPGSSTPVRVTLAQGGQRSGIFTHGSVLTVNSQPRRTSPVKRGKWALDQILCIDIPPPPAGVEGTLDAPGATGTLRERLAAHRTNPACAACHDYLDPIGLGLESYDAIGAFRTLDAGEAIDASGAFPDGRSFDGVAEMAALVKADPNTPRCVAERLLTYALGRGLDASDDAALDAITAAFQANGRSLESLIAAIVQSPPFRLRRGEPDS